MAGHPRVYELFEELANIHERKSMDYDGPDNPLASMRGAERFGISPWVGVMRRIDEKWGRAVNMVTAPAATVDEAMVDTLKDIAVYAMIAIVLKEEEEGT